MSVPEKLKKAREFLGKKQTEMSELVGLGPSTWQVYELGNSKPGSRAFEALAELGFNINWFFRDDAPMRLGGTTDDTAAAGEFVHIPRYDVAASAGGGAVVHDEQVVDYLSFRAEWVKIALGVSVRDLALISVIGDSMEPALSEGDVVLLDLTTKSVLDGSIYALQLNGGLLVKRIQRMLDGSLVVKSDNPRYDTEVVTEGKADLVKIVGRVVWIGKRL